MQMAAKTVVHAARAGAVTSPPMASLAASAATTSRQSTSVERTLRRPAVSVDLLTPAMLAAVRPGRWPAAESVDNGGGCG
jgi:hypothetical protein